MRISSYEDGAEYARRFRSDSVQSLDLNMFDLLLAATRAMRRELVKQHPMLRDRAFTVREALALVGRPLSTAEAATLIAKGPAPVMLARRGSGAPDNTQRFIRRRRALDPLDLPDAHNDRRTKRHVATVELAVTVGDELGSALQAWRIAAPGLV